MTRPILILRPEPGATATAGRASKLGLKAIVAPLFTVAPIATPAVDPARFEAVLLTSANAARFGPKSLTGLPCYAVGGATAEAAGRAGYRDIRCGPSDGAAAAAMIAADGLRHVVHPCGRDHIEIVQPGLRIESLPVYAAEALDALPQAARRALGRGALTLLHSPRAAAHFSALVGDRDSIAILAISRAAAAAAGEGWASKHWVEQPSDEALLELAVQLCQTGVNDETGYGG